MTMGSQSAATPELRWENEGGRLRTSHGDETATPPDTEARSRLSDVHALLLHQVATRGDAVLAALGTSRWPQRELESLVDYLQMEVIPETRLKERLLFTCADTTAADAFARLADDHVTLRYALEDLTSARNIPETRDSQALADTVRRLVTHLTEHLSREESTLARYTLKSGWQRAATARQQQPHTWYPLTHGPVIDLDAFTATWSAIEAVACRVDQLRPGEHVELVASAEPEGLCCRLQRDCDIAVCCMSSGSTGWRAKVTRRGPE